MRFISPSGAYRLVVIHDQVQFGTDNITRTSKPGYTAEFKMGFLTPFERQLARERLQFAGGIIDRQNVDGSPYDYIDLTGLFDTDWIEDDPALKAEVEKRMLANPGCGNPADFILVEQPKLPAPWPSYDQLTVHGQRKAKHVAEKNLEIAAATGVPIEDLVAYERENRNDPDVIAAYEAANTVAAEPEETLVRA